MQLNWLWYRLRDQGPSSTSPPKGYRLTHIWIFRDMTLINQAIDTTRDLIACHDSDTRYDDVECRSSVAALYLPIVGLVIGALPQLHGYGSEDNSSITPDVAMAIATSSITTLMSSDERSDIGSQVINMH